MRADSDTTALQMRLFVTRPRQVLLAFRASRRLCRVAQCNNVLLTCRRWVKPAPGSLKIAKGGQFMKRNQGFSLLELLIVVAIILIIATIAIPSLLRSRQSAQESSAVAQIRTINTAEITYLSSNQGAYGSVAQLITQGLRFQACCARGSQRRNPRRSHNSERLTQRKLPISHRMRGPTEIFPR